MDTAFNKYELVYANGLWICASYNHGMWWSEDGKAWTQGTGENTAYSIYGVAYADGVVICGGAGNGMWWSGEPVYIPETA